MIITIYFALRLMREPDSDGKRLLLMLAALVAVTYATCRIATR